MRFLFDFVPFFFLFHPQDNTLTTAKDNLRNCVDRWNDSTPYVFDKHSKSISSVHSSISSSIGKSFSRFYMWCLYHSSLRAPPAVELRANCLHIKKHKAEHKNWPLAKSRRDTKKKKRKNLFRSFSSEFSAKRAHTYTQTYISNNILSFSMLYGNQKSTETSFWILILPPLAFDVAKSLKKLQNIWKFTERERWSEVWENVEGVKRISSDW